VDGSSFNVNVPGGCAPGSRSQSAVRPPHPRPKGRRPRADDAPRPTQCDSCKPVHRLYLKPPGHRTRSPSAAFYATMEEKEGGDDDSPVGL
jgi:hypothetical protein